ncbi:MAG: exodeoxyribonuclease VII large subunit, partial [Proteocatella sp.]
LYPSAVQGDSAHEEIIEGLKHFNKEKKSDRPDVLILARGGGSYEELIAFNNELLAYEIFKSKIPVISAVGHETDFTIADFVADYRASTPSMAAEVAVPNLKNILLELETKLNLMNREIWNILEADSKKLISMGNLLQSYNPSAVLDKKCDELLKCKKDLDQLMNSKLEKNDLLLNSKREQLILLNPLNLLDRGYAVVYKENQKPAYRAAGLIEDEIISIKFFDGSVSARVIGDKNEI